MSFLKKKSTHEKGLNNNYFLFSFFVIIQINVSELILAGSHCVMQEILLRK